MSSAFLVVLLAVTTIIAVCKSAHVRGCYYTDGAQNRPNKGKFLPENYVKGMCTHIFYFARLNSDFTVKAINPNDESTPTSKGLYERISNLKKLQPGLKTLLSFSTKDMKLIRAMIGSLPNLHKFINSAIDFVRKHNFDGIDLDFQYPGAGDKRNFAAFGQLTRTAFEQESARVSKPRLLFTAAVSPNYDVITAGYDVPWLTKSVDFFNVKTYDFHGSSEHVTGMNAPLHDGTKKDSDSVSGAMNVWIKKGAPKQKLMMGFAAYGHGWTLSNGGNNTKVGASAKGPSNPLPYSNEKGNGYYYEMCTFLENGAKQYVYDVAKTPYLVKGDQWFGYDDVTSYKAKLDLLKQNGFGGAFTYALDFDDFNGQCKSSGGQKFPLHKAIADALN